MQRVSRSIFAGLLAIASLTACGDKVTVPGPTTITIGNGGSSGLVHGVTVTPTSVQLAVNQTTTLVASVNADAGVARTVTWASTNAAIATVTSAGVVTAVSSGTVSITAAATADPTQIAAASIIVTPVTATAVSISTINVNCAGVPGCVVGPVNLAAVAGQVDVTVNVDPGTQTVTEVDLIVNPSSTGVSDTIVASQSGVSLNKIKSGANASSVFRNDLSFNTAAFNKGHRRCGLPQQHLHDQGQCQARGVRRRIAPLLSTQSATFANVDVINVTEALPNSAVDGAGITWFGGALTVTAIPTMYTPGRAIKSVSVTSTGLTGTTLTWPPSPFRAR